MADETLSEEWRPVEGWPDYEVSSLGRVRRATAGLNGAGYVAWPKGRLVKLKRQSSGHYSVALHFNGRHRFFLVHRLVCAAFHGPAPSRKHEGAHFNGDASDNGAGNLRWATHIENIADKIRHGRTNRGIQNLNAKLTETAVREIRGLLAAGTLKQVQIAREFNISPAHVTDIKSGKVWAWLDCQTDSPQWTNHIENMSAEMRHKRSARGERHSNARLTATDVREIRTLLAAGTLRQAQIARQFGVSSSLVHLLKIRRSWAWLD